MTKVDDVITAARAQLGSPYVFGDEGPDTFDCSGLIQFVLARIGIRAPRTAAEQQRWTTPVRGTPRPGDLVFYDRPATHVALYIGNGKMIAAPHAGAVVAVQSVYGTPAGYGRVPGLGAALSPITGLAQDAVRGVGGGLQDVAFGVSDILGVARRTLLEVTMASLGLALIGYGLWRATKTQRQTAMAEIGSVL
ncbi:MAG TPA: NlpC/P60 family protein [Micromonosporaceae bacterium]|jgi:hypothetical protein|nr:NlpC/P60 family protein [Micromonosporaceae bacterium]